MPHLIINFDWNGPDDELNALLKPLADALKAQKSPEPEKISVELPDVKITGDYSSIMVVKDVVEPWIEAFSGDEWGEQVGRAHDAIQTDYGMDDEDVAIIAKLVYKAVADQYLWWRQEGVDYIDLSAEALEEIYAEASAARAYWASGGNLGSWEPALSAANATIETLPAWLFGEDALELAS